MARLREGFDGRDAHCPVPAEPAATPVAAELALATATCVGRDRCAPYSPSDCPGHIAHEKRQNVRVLMITLRFA